MRQSPRQWFWVEAGFGALSVILLVLTLIVPHWIEAVMHVNPDQHSGWLEWLIVGGLGLSAVLSSLLARREWRQAALGLSTTR